ncbi:MAG: selenocysteine-specific translation elongation factor [bacterium]|nr:selenocysteine-specific translation elongation factor [bacterium]
MARVIVGTAGHIDHGKSALVRALTGTDPDRLPEEKRRGITLDLGYAFLDDVAAIIDVPGHERLIRNMVAGAATVDFALLVVAADDGVMPQTQEHIAILRLLAVRSGVIAITKTDLVEPDWLNLVEDQIRSAVHGTFLESAPIFRVDSLSGRGLPELRSWLIAALGALPSRTEKSVFRLPLDRVFVIKGRGSVVTGTILSGQVKRDNRLVILPGGFSVRVKRLETHGSEQEMLSAGQRAALNLIGDTDHLKRGATLTMPGTILQTSRLKVAVELISEVLPVKDRQRIRFLIGTDEAIGRLQILDRSGHLCFAQLSLESDVVAAWGDHFILRRYSPLETLGGGRVLEPDSPPLSARNKCDETVFARELDTDSLTGALLACLRRRGKYGMERTRLANQFALTEQELESLLQALPDGQVAATISEYLILSASISARKVELLQRLSHLHEAQPSAAGFSRSDLFRDNLALLPLPIQDFLLNALIADGILEQQGPLFRDVRRTVTLDAEERQRCDNVLRILKRHGFAPPSAVSIAEELNVSRSHVEKTLVLLDRLGRCRRLGTDLFFETAEFEKATSTVREALRRTSELTVADATRILFSSRKFVVPFLEYLDQVGITRRIGNVRVAAGTHDYPENNS